MLYEVITLYTLYSEIKNDYLSKNFITQRIEFKEIGFYITACPLDSSNSKLLVIKTPEDILYGESNTILVYILILGLIGVFIISIVTIAVSSILSKPITKTALFTQEVAKGDLTQQPEIRKDIDELSILNNSLHSMVKKLAEVVLKINNRSKIIQTSATNLVSYTNEINNSSSSIAATSQEISSTLVELSSTIEQNTDNARETSRISQVALKKVQQSNNSSQKARDAMGMVAERISIIQERNNFV